MQQVDKEQYAMKKKAYIHECLDFRNVLCTQE